MPDRLLRRHRGAAQVAAPPTSPPSEAAAEMRSDYGPLTAPRSKTSVDRPYLSAPRRRRRVQPKQASCEETRPWSKRQQPWVPREDGFLRDQALQNFFFDGRFEDSVGYLQLEREGVFLTSRQSARKEIPWNEIPAAQRPAFLKAFESEWQQWLRLGAGEVVPPDQAQLSMSRRTRSSAAVRCLPTRTQ